MLALREQWFFAAIAVLKFFRCFPQYTNVYSRRLLVAMVIVIYTQNDVCRCWKLVFADPCFPIDIIGINWEKKKLLFCMDIMCSASSACGQVTAPYSKDICNISAFKRSVILLHFIHLVTVAMTSRKGLKKEVVTNN